LYLLVAARDPGARRFFLYFTAWANLAHGALMVGRSGGVTQRSPTNFFCHGDESGPIPPSTLMTRFFAAQASSRLLKNSG
jgi:hypothetical protein